MVVVDFSASPFVVPAPCEIVVMTDFTITEFWCVSLVSPTTSLRVFISRISFGWRLVAVLLVDVLKTDKRPMTSSVVCEHNVVTVEFKWSRTESIVMSPTDPTELVIVSLA